jgi:prepilin-type N-terminal cleavage/methylation domain-containing protein
MRKSNFTLMELLIVTAILAIIGGSVVMSYSGAYEQSNKELLKFRTSLVYKALVKFKKDMGYYPKQDKVAFEEVKNPAPSDLSADKQEWFEDTQNFNQLFEEPVDQDIDNLWKWNIDSKRGWQGPYINDGHYSELNTDDEPLISSQHSDIFSKDFILAFQKGKTPYYFTLTFDDSSKKYSLTYPDPDDIDKTISQELP